MNKETRQKVEILSKKFASGFTATIGDLNGSGWLIVDPLSGYLNACGYSNECKQLPASDTHPLVLVIVFEDGTQFIPAGGDLKSISPEATNWMWI